MFKQVLFMTTRLGEYFHAREAKTIEIEKTPAWKRIGLPEQHSEDFKPELKQEFDFVDGLFSTYVNRDELVYNRVYMPFRWNKIETNTKYLGQIMKIINARIEYLVR